ncbi:MAG: hypothetical protein JWM90_1674 [Thermoleophilia bacterium]|nr:hypothetical protein [Thermoleophilia bacterium]
MTTRTDLTLTIAGAAGAALWALQQPIDKRAFASGYDDVELLGRAVTSGPAWKSIGFAMHVANGAAFGFLFARLRRRAPGLSPRVAGQLLAQVENFGLYPLAAIVDRVHPAREQLSPAFGARQLAQATWRHAILGAVVGEAAARVERRERIERINAV